ncbi:phage portal protein [Humibacter ginsenosidimutans]|uniref:Phage portal protein n=1 Tax=Humibacter ginsenosidimutans TaxID=2599293 RepID=A0A5B8M6P2_9MICO|nr:phage portal protein [Humibacter ginsenosidimutans]QDZ15789.1 phage portal protein [Humibacter ginsenosidimutans]
MAAASDVFPPQPFDIAFARFTEHDAWYCGDTATLAEIYQGKIGPTTHIRAGIPYRGGVIGTLSKFWWGQPQEPDEHRMKMHLPVPADLAQLSADLLFAEAPKIRYAKPDAAEAAGDDDTNAPAPSHPGQDRLDLIMGSDDAHAEMLKGGEFAASLGGTYFSVVWDADLEDHVWFQAFAADCAIPEFRYGKLVGCTLWTEYQTENASTVYRLLEIHKPGVITYELHQGGPNNLGNIVPMGTLPETEHYLNLVPDVELSDLGPLTDDTAPTMNATIDDDSAAVTVATGVNKLAVVYMPNMLPARDWRKYGPIANLGRSDFAGNEDIFDKIDQVYSSLMRDIDNGAGRITVPESFLETSGQPGGGASFDMNRQVYVGVNALGGPSDTVAQSMTISQFDIRVQEHLEAIDGLKRELATATGYSPVHLGLQQTRAGQRTATEVTADLSDSERTRDKKALYAKPALAKLAQVALAIDGIVFPGQGGGWFDELPDIEFAEVSQVDPLKNAQTVQVLDAARAASIKTRVRMVHPDWEDDEVNVEAAAIQAEEASMVSPMVPPFSGSTDMNGEQDGDNPTDE